MTEESSTQAKARADYHEQRQSAVMMDALAVFVATVASLNFMFLPLDYWAFPEHIRLFFGARCVLFGVLSVVYFKTRFTHPKGSCVVSILAMSAMLLTMIWADGGVTSMYSTGLVLMFCGIPVLLPLSVREMARAVSPALGLYALMPLFDSAHLSAIDYALHVFFPLGGALVAVGSAALLEQIRLRDFMRCRELEQARDHLKEMDRVKASFTANIHHELRTPLTLTLAPLEALLSGEFGAVSPLQRSYLKSMHSNALRLLKLINNLLDLAKIESRQLHIQRQPVQLDNLCEELVWGARPLAERKGVELSLVARDVPMVNADAEAVEKVLANLISNALKFTEDGQCVEIRVDAEGEGLHFIVADTGLGMPPDQLEHIFDRFAQVDSSSTRRFEGTGIGLSLAKELVELHGGRIWAESQGVGQGSQMHFTLPHGESDVESSEAIFEADEADSLAAGGAPGDQEQRRSLRGAGELAELERSVVRALGSDGEVTADPSVPDDAPEVLIVEDNADMRRLLVFLVGREFRLRVAKNGREGLELVRERLPDLVLTDVMMPEMSGTELCREIKSDPETSGVPVILVTSKAERQMKVEGLELGAEDYVTKPFHPRELMARVRSLVRLHRLQDELIGQNELLERTNDELRSTMDQLRETGAQLAQSERLAAVGELAAGIAHEVNNPLNYSLNALRALGTQSQELRELIRALEGLEGASPSSDEQKLAGLAKLMDDLDPAEIPTQLDELLAIAMDGLERTERLVQDLHHFAAPATTTKASLDVRGGVTSTLALMRHALRTAGVEVKLQLPDTLPPVRGDQRSINQVFLNLLKNASEAMAPAGGTIDVSARLDGSQVVVEISDNGPGIEEEVREQLFTPFFTTKRAGSGSGLGLSMCRRILEDHCGSIVVKSVPGEGATFSVALPVDDDSEG